MVADVATLRSKRPELKTELLCDGAQEMWNWLEGGFRPRFGDDLHCLVDLVLADALERYQFRRARREPGNQRRGSMMNPLEQRRDAERRRPDGPLARTQ